MPAPKTIPTDLAHLIADTVALYDGLFTDIRIEQRFATGLPLVRLDAEQIKRVMINLMDNAIEAMERRGSGLGLAIVRRIIAEHGGNIDVGDNTPRGTRFTIELPC